MLTTLKNNTSAITGGHCTWWRHNPYKCRRAGGYVE